MVRDVCCVVLLLCVCNVCMGVCCGVCAVCFNDVCVCYVCCGACVCVVCVCAVRLLDKTALVIILCLVAVDPLPLVARRSTRGLCVSHVLCTMCAAATRTSSGSSRTCS